MDNEIQKLLEFSKDRTPVTQKDDSINGICLSRNT